MSRLGVAACLSLLLLPAAVLAWLGRDMPYFGLPYDDGMYYSSAKSMAENGGYRLPYLPNRAADTNHPPLYSAYLSLVWRIDPQFPRNLRLAIWFAWLPLAILLPAWYVFWREYQFSMPERLALTAAAAVNFAVLLASITLMSDLIFTLLLFAGLLALRRAGVSGALLAGLALGAAALTRTAVLPFAGAAVLYCLLRREWSRAAVVAGVFAPFPAAWMLWASRQPALAGEAGYTLQFSPVALWQNLGHTLASAGNLVLPGSAAWLGGVPAEVLGVACLAGAWRLLAGKRSIARWPVLHLAALPYLGILLVWRWSQSPSNPRWLLPLYPFLLAGFYTELRHFTRLIVENYRRGKGAGRIAPVVCGALVVLFGGAFLRGNLAHYGALLDTITGARASLAAERPAYAWMQANLAADAVVLTRNAAALFLHTGLRAVALPSDFAVVDVTPQTKESVVRAWPERMRRMGAGYLYLASSTLEEGHALGVLAVALERDAGLRRVYATSSAAVLEQLGNGP
jgi:hypothetical protein